MSEEITLDKEVFKALAGETRVAVLKALLERRKTQSELAKELGLAAPTIKDHLDILQKASLVVEINDGHKWKYIQLTVKGKSLLQPQDKRILVLLGTSLLGIAASTYLAYNHFISALPPMAPSPESFDMMATKVAADTLGGGASAAGATGTAMIAPAADVVPQAAAQAPLMAAQVFPILPMFELTILVVCLVVFGVSVGMWIKHSY